MDKSTTEPRKRKIVIGMDGSKNAEDAFKWYAETLHEKGDFVIAIYTPEFKKLTHVSCMASHMSMMTADPALMTKLIEEEQQQTRLLLGEIHELMNVADIKGTVKQMMGVPGEEIVKVAEDEGADFIITGSRGLGTIRRTLLGSVSDYIVHHSPVPVFVCKPELQCHD
ncbi:putative universal stress protein SERP1273 isoform X2 [Mercenaria mercenaria]|uniref:putative universal stress protein SERP1273 isoform X2 n=1 Tax=Mercenaria mercenaria TaxID=6596 RepID=UPI00234E4918|nr:putative universal stress protein SERP1273 isoform X2 [Mercenaria mercenaria]